VLCQKLPKVPFREKVKVPLVSEFFAKLTVTVAVAELDPFSFSEQEGMLGAAARAGIPCYLAGGIDALTETIEATAGEGSEVDHAGACAVQEGTRCAACCCCARAFPRYLAGGIDAPTLTAAIAGEGSEVDHAGACAVQEGMHGCKSAGAKDATPRYLAGGIDAAKTTPYATGDPRAPRSVYGQSKADAEVQLGQILAECCIVRTSWLFGTGGKCFPDTILKLAESRPQLEVVGDQRGSPTYVVDLARAIIQLCRKDASGIVHATNRGECSWYEFAREIIANSGLQTIVRETSSDKFVRPAQRPKYSVLSPESLQKYGIVAPGWRDALQRYLAERKSD